ncbi:hypothetical protein TIFTF001_028882 [Ficus carica]|uniref:Uncharacterized protein n=1 Tax=Ficus carica TaxID=3494 RepID=A0AA88DQS4_FICCA|nr:hypothetical protein TIFTF001_028882 [Ficus carica]
MREKKTDLGTEWRVEAMEILGDLRLEILGLLEEDDGKVTTELSLRRAIFGVL